MTRDRGATLCAVELPVVATAHPRSTERTPPGQQDQATDADEQAGHNQYGIQIRGSSRCQRAEGRTETSSHDAPAPISFAVAVLTAVTRRLGSSTLDTCLQTPF
jgi:hypothetical protein